MASNTNFVDELNACELQGAEATTSGEAAEQVDDDTELEQFAERDQVYPKLRTRSSILHCLFHPTQPNLIALAHINGRLKM